ncbi:MAG: nucleotidyltransferase family protein [Acidimicrobiia bacterium]|nr:nucleotidyltransferase family protein [Acidimicrobiia bacterium]
MTEAVAALAAYRLADAPIEVDSWSALMDEADRHHLIGVLAAAVDDDAVAPGPDPARLELSAQHEALMVATMNLERTLLAVAEVLDAAAVPLRVLKGPALAHTVALDPSHRTFGDVDVLVPGELIEGAVAALIDAGAVRPSPELAPGYDRRFAKSVTLVWDGHEVDVHRTLAPGPFGLRIDQPSLWAGASSFELGGRMLATLDRERHLVHGCYHAVLGDIEPRLASLRDIALLADARALDHDVVRDLARCWQGEAVLAEGLRRTAAALPGRTGGLYDWAAERTPSAADRAAFDSYRTEHRRFARQSLASLRAIDGWGDRAAFVRAVVWPSRAHLDARDLSRRRHLLRR